LIARWGWRFWAGPHPRDTGHLGRPRVSVFFWRIPDRPPAENPMGRLYRANVAGVGATWPLGCRPGGRAFRVCDGTVEKAYHHRGDFPNTPVLTGSSALGHKWGAQKRAAGPPLPVARVSRGLLFLEVTGRETMKTGSHRGGDPGGAPGGNRGGGGRRFYVVAEFLTAPNFGKGLGGGGGPETGRKGNRAGAWGGCSHLGADIPRFSGKKKPNGGKKRKGLGGRGGGDTKRVSGAGGPQKNRHRGASFGARGGGGRGGGRGQRGGAGARGRFLNYGGPQAGPLPRGGPPGPPPPAGDFDMAPTRDQGPTG